MRIFYFSGATIPSQSAQSVHLMKMCQALGKAGHDVTLYARGNSSEDINLLYQQYGVIDCFKISLSKDIRLPLIGGIVRLFHIFKTVRRLPKADVYYGRDPIALSLFSDKNGKVVYEAHQMAYLPTHKYVTKYLQKCVHFRGFVVISNALKEDFLSAYPALDENKVLVAHDGADLPDQGDVVPAKLQGEAKKFKVGYAGSLHEGKGAELIIKMAAAMPEVEFHILGGSKEQISALEESSSDNVYYYGHLPHSEMQGYLSSFDVLLAPYQREARIKTGQDIARWISPMKLFEYMALSKPILCSDLPVLREVMRNEENALMLPPDNSSAWVEAIERLKDDKGLGKRLGEQAFEDLKEQYSWNERARKMVEFCS